MRLVILACMLYQGLSVLLMLGAVVVVGLNITRLRALDSTMIIVLMLAFSIAFSLNGLLCHGQHRMNWAEQFTQHNDEYDLGLKK